MHRTTLVDRTHAWARRCCRGGDDRLVGDLQALLPDLIAGAELLHDLSSLTDQAVQAAGDPPLSPPVLEEVQELAVEMLRTIEEAEVLP